MLRNQSHQLKLRQPPDGPFRSSYLKMWELLRKNPYRLSFAWLHAFFSGWGQTFQIALFVPALKSVHQLDNTEFGLVFSLATLVSAVLLPLSGRFMDAWPLKLSSFAIGLIMASGALLLALSPHMWSLIVGLILLRWSGQGLMGQMPGFAVARFFNRTRGKALAIANLGFPASEALFPIIIAGVIAHDGWQAGFWFIFGITILVFIPISQWLLTHRDRFNLPRKPKAKPRQSEVLTLNTLLADPHFYLLLPQHLISPFLLTGFFFHQGVIGDIKNWDISILASGFVFFALFRSSLSFLVGPLVDRLTARRVYPWITMPLILGFLILGLVPQAWAGPIYLSICGASVGLGTTVKAAIWAEVYGVKSLGWVKSFIGMLAVIGTAISPAVFGWYFDNFQSLTPLVLTCSALVLITSLMAYGSSRLSKD